MPWAIAAGLADKNTPDEEAAKTFIAAIQAMKKRYGIGDHIPEIREEDIPKLHATPTRKEIPFIPFLSSWTARSWNNSIIF